MSYLSRKRIEEISSKVLMYYKNGYLPEKRLCYRVDPIELAAMLGLQIDYQILSDDNTILGMTSSGGTFVTVWDDDKTEMDYYLDGNTILVEKRLLKSPKNVGRLNFTITHEIGHQIIYRLFPHIYTADCKVVSSYRNGSQQKIENWTEWQADAFAAALLMPKDAIQDAMFYVGLGDKMKVLNKQYSLNNYEKFCEMANLLHVSKTALSYRMEYLGLLERNLMLT